jgi:hypothetical protein
MLSYFAKLFDTTVNTIVCLLYRWSSSVCFLCAGRLFPSVGRCVCVWVGVCGVRMPVRGVLRRFERLFSPPCCCAEEGHKGKGRAGRTTGPWAAGCAGLCGAAAACCSRHGHCEQPSPQLRFLSLCGWCMLLRCAGRCFHSQIGSASH